MFRQGDIIDGRYRVFAVKQGGMGYVYLCEDSAFVKGGQALKVAVKTIKPEIERIPGAADRFYNEARLWVELGKAPNIVQALYVKRLDGLPYIFTEFIRSSPELGPDLQGWIGKPVLDLETALQFALQFCNGMIYVTEVFAEKGMGFVHRDIKPGNTMIDDRRRLKITDFGLAKIADTADELRTNLPVDPLARQNMNLTVAGAVLGTPKYMSPEQCRGERQFDARADIYSFGCMFYEMLTGSTPFVAGTMKELLAKHLHERPLPPSVLVPRLPGILNGIVLKCLEKDRSGRFVDFLELRTELAEIYTAQTEKEPPPLFQKEAEKAGLGEKLNKSLSLYELGEKREGVKLFAEVIGARNILGEKRSDTQGLNRNAQQSPPRILVKGGLAPDAQKQGATPGKAPTGPGDSDRSLDRTIAPPSQNVSGADPRRPAPMQKFSTHYERPPQSATPPKPTHGTHIEGGAEGKTLAPGTPPRPMPPKPTHSTHIEGGAEAKPTAPAVPQKKIPPQQNAEQKVPILPIDRKKPT